MRENIKTVSVRISSDIFEEIVSRKKVSGRSIKSETEHLIKLGIVSRKKLINIHTSE